MKRRMWTWLCLFSFFAAPVGCSTAEPKKAPEEQAATDLQLFVLGYQNFLDNKSHPPGSLDDLKTTISSDRPIDFSRYHIIWGVDLNGVKDARTVLAYETDTPQKGGTVVFCDAKVEKVTAEQFQKLPKAVVKSLADRPADATLTPGEYYAEYKKLDQGGMEKKYKNKVVELKGVVKTLRSVSGKPELWMISPGKEKEDVRCFLPGGGEFWAKVGKGQQVTVRGFVNAPLTLTACEITATGPGTAVTITAAELAKEIAADGEKATAKYKGKSFILTGEVISVAERATTFRVAKLKGTADQPIECSFFSGGSTKQRDKKLVPGAKLKLYAEYDTGYRLLDCELISE